MKVMLFLRMQCVYKNDPGEGSAFLVDAMYYKTTLVKVMFFLFIENGPGEGPVVPVNAVYI